MGILGPQVYATALPRSARRLRRGFPSVRPVEDAEVVLKNGSRPPSRLSLLRGWWRSGIWTDGTLFGRAGRFSAMRRPKGGPGVSELSSASCATTVTVAGDLDRRPLVSGHQRSLGSDGMTLA